MRFKVETDQKTLIPLFSTKLIDELPVRIQRYKMRLMRKRITKTLANAASSVWWPGIPQDITKVMQNCATCEKYRAERIEPIKGAEFPDRSRSRVGIDFFKHNDKHYLLAVD